MGDSQPLGEGVRHSKTTTDKKKADLGSALGGSKVCFDMKLIIAYERYDIQLSTNFIVLLFGATSLFNSATCIITGN